MISTDQISVFFHKLSLSITVMAWASFLMFIHIGDRHFICIHATVAAEI